MTQPTADTQQRVTSAFQIAVPLDGSDRAAQALPVASDLCRKLGGELVLVRVVLPVVLPYTMAAGTVGGGYEYEPAGVYEQLHDDAEREAREYLERTAASIQAQGIAVTTRLMHGEPGAALLDVVSSQHIALVVMTTHGRTGLARTVLGSVADQVVRSSKEPVVLLRSVSAPPDSRQAVAFSRALVPLDGTPIAEIPLFAIGLQIAGPVLREITLLRVVDPKDGEEGTPGWSAAEEYLDAVQRRLIDRLQEQGRACAVNRLVRKGSDPAAAIVACAQAEGCDLVLMATHSAAGIGRIVFGSVTDRVLRDGKSPLLVMHPSQS